MIEEITENKYILKNNLKGLDYIIKILKNGLFKIGMQKRDIIGLLLSFEEIVNNSYKHGYNNDLTNNSIEIEFSFTTEKVLIHVKDFGVGFDATAYEEPDLANRDIILKPTGKGIFLVHHYVDKTIINSTQGKGTEVTIIKYPILESNIIE